MPKLADLINRHPEHLEYQDHWELLDAMVSGGHKMTKERKKKLLANPDGRPDSVIEERVKVATYTNKLGPILSRFISQLLEEEAHYEGSNDPYWKNEFFPQGARLDGDDDGRASFHTFLRFAALQAFTTGKAIAQVDVSPIPSVRNRREQRTLKGDAPYVVLLPRTALWDWESDKEGFVFTKIHRFEMIRRRWDEPRIPQHDFTIYQREDDGKVLASRYLVTPRLRAGESPPADFNLEYANEDKVIITPFGLPNGEALEEKEIFNVRGEYRFPLLTLTLPNSLWIADQLFDCQKSYYNQTAGVEWRMLTSNFAMPVISGVEDIEDDPFAGPNGKRMGDGFYLTLPSEQSIFWLEPPGGAVSTSISYRDNIKIDIYDTLQQIAMSASDGTAILARSGISKKEDRRPEQILLEIYGGLMRDFAKQIMDAASIARGETTQWVIEGWQDFLGEGLDEDIADINGVATSGVFESSDTLRKATQKRFARRVSEAMDFDKATTDKIMSEIDASKPPPPPMPMGGGFGATEEIPPAGEEPVMEDAQEL